MDYVGTMTDPTAIPNFNPAPAGQPTTPNAGGGSQLRDRVLAVFAEDGIEATVDADGDVSYQLEDQQLFVRLIEGEPGLLRVFGQWAIGDDLGLSLEKQLLAANDVTLSLNIIKTGIANGTLVVTGEHLVTEQADLRMLLQTTTNMVLQAVQLWHQAATGEGPHAANTDPAEIAALMAQAQAEGEGGQPPVQA